MNEKKIKTTIHVRNNTPIIKLYFCLYRCISYFRYHFSLSFGSNRNASIEKQFSSRTLIQRYVGFIRLHWLACTSIYVE